MIVQQSQLDKAAEALRLQQLSGSYIQPWEQLPDSAKNVWRMAVMSVIQSLELVVEGDTNGCSAGCDNSHAENSHAVQ